MTDEIHFTVSLWFPLDAFVNWISGVVVSEMQNTRLVAEGKNFCYACVKTVTGINIYFCG